jgi:hypothetical protein
MHVAFVSPNKFIIKIDSTIYLMILIMYHKYILIIFLYINVVKVISQEARTTVI